MKNNIHEELHTGFAQKHCLQAMLPSCSRNPLRPKITRLQNKLQLRHKLVGILPFTLISWSCKLCSVCYALFVMFVIIILSVLDIR